jgi:ssRNA-specific RNase YbeY (16S rRNA maturation enzyme)
LGYDHERGSALQAQQMEQYEREIFSQLIERFPLTADR